MPHQCNRVFIIFVIPRFVISNFFFSIYEELITDEGEITEIKKEFNYCDGTPSAPQRSTLFTDSQLVIYLFSHLLSSLLRVMLCVDVVLCDHVCYRVMMCAEM